MRDEVYGKGTGRRGSSRGSIVTKVPEYDLSGMSDEEVQTRERKLRVSRPAGRDAVTVRTLEIETTAKPAAKGLRITSAKASAEQFIVFWESPGGESAAGDGTIRDHEYKHVNAGNAAVERFNRNWQPRTIKVPGGDMNAAWQGYDDLQLRLLRIRLQRVDDAIDRY